MLQSRRIATVSSSAAEDAMTRLAELARAGDATRFAGAVRLYDEGTAGPPADDPPVGLCAHRCKACGNGYLQVDPPAALAPGGPPPRTDITSEFAAALFRPAGSVPRGGAAAV
jgi:hypothetical protein